MGCNMCRERAESASDSKNTIDRILGRLHGQMCPSGFQTKTMTNMDADKNNVYQIPTWPYPESLPPTAPPRTAPPKVIRRTPEVPSGWTEVSLQVPETPPKRKTAALMSEQPSQKAPLPPPRKNRQRIREILDRATSHDGNNRKLADEPIAIEIREVNDHICDRHNHNGGRSNHSGSTANHNGGKTNHNGSNHNHNSVKVKDTLGLNKQQLRKAHSTGILPNYEALEFTVSAGPEEQAATKQRLTTSRNVPTSGQNGLSVSQTTAQRLENYMTRCRSFGSLLPQQIMDRLKTHHTESDTESEDSWGGLDDWDLGVIEHDTIQDGMPPYSPNSRLAPKQRNDVAFTIGNSNRKLTIPSNSKRDDEKIDTYKPDNLTIKPADHNGDNDSDRTPTPSIVIQDESDLTPTNEKRYEFPEEKSPAVDQSNLRGRRESIETVDDWFVHTEKPNAHPLDDVVEKMENPVDTEIPLQYDMNSYPFYAAPSDPLNSDSFFTTQLLVNERDACLEDTNGKKLKDSPKIDAVHVLPDIKKRSLNPFIIDKDPECTVDIKIPDTSSQGHKVVEPKVEAKDHGTTKKNDDHDVQQDQGGESSGLLKSMENDIQTVLDALNKDQKNLPSN